MKKLIIILIVLFAISCSKEGEIEKTSSQFFKINGKEYKFIKVIPADGEPGVWLLIPKDASVEIPPSFTHRISCGKNCTRNYQCFWINEL